LGRQIVHLIRLDLAHDPAEAGGVEQVTVVKEEANALFMRVTIEVIDSLGGEVTGPADDAVHLISLLEEQLRQIRAVLPGDSGDECGFVHG
jgi:hypothetical protein